MKNRIVDLARRCGVRDVGFCRFSEVEPYLIPCRAMQRLPENSQTVIVFLFPYKVKEERPQNISRYAAVPDYHTVCGKYLQKAEAALKEAFPDYRFASFIDNSPIPEVRAAATAGLGVQGLNHMLIHKRWGSWCFIGEIVTDLPVEAENHFQKCSLCGDCVKACPSGDQGEKCLSALSQQKKPLTDAEKQRLRERNIVWGCDLCMESCPMNRGAAITYLPEFHAGYRDRYEPGEDITGRAYAWRGEAVVRRNALLGDSGGEKE